MNDITISILFASIAAAICPAYMEAHDCGIILTPPEGEDALMVKSGDAYGCDGVGNLWRQPSNGSLVSTVMTDDGEFYMNNPFSQVLPEESGIIDYGGMPCDFTFEYGYLKGERDGDNIVFRFPQPVQHVIYDLDMGMGLGDDYIFDYLYYALVLKWDEGEGTYLPVEDQTFRLLRDADGSYRAEDPSLMIGQCIAFEEGDNVRYAWQMNGDFDISISPQTAKVTPVPDGLDYTSWNLVGNLNARSVSIAFDGDDCYIKGLCTGKGMEEAVVKGTISQDGSTVSLASGQFIGNYFAELIEAYFIGYTPGDDGSIIDKALVLGFDRERNVMQTEGHGFLFSTMPDDILSFQRVADPYIAMENPEAMIESLRSPIISNFYPADEYYDAELLFDIPTVDADHNVLDKTDIYFSLYVGTDEDPLEPFAFYSDEYPEITGDMEGATEIPFGFNGYNIMYDGANGYDLIIFSRDFTVLGVRTCYRNGDNTIYSPFAWVEGYEPSAIEEVSEREPVEVEYFNLQGMRVSSDSKGIIVRKTRYSDGTESVAKIMNNR